MEQQCVYSENNFKEKFIFRNSMYYKCNLLQNLSKLQKECEMGFILYSFCMMFKMICNITMVVNNNNNN